MISFLFFKEIIITLKDLHSCSIHITIHWLGNAAYKPIPNFVLMKLRDIMNEESEDESNGASLIIEKSARSSNVRYQMDTFSRPLSAW